MGKPLLIIKLKRNDKLTVSKALAKSSFSRIASSFEVLTWCMISRAAKKFSSINLPSTKAVCCVETSVGSYSLDLLASTFEMSLGKTLIILIVR